MVAETSREYQRKKATFQEKSDLFDIWRPLPDLNRCRRRERAVSWAGLDEGDVWSTTPVPPKRSLAQSRRDRREYIPEENPRVNIFFAAAIFFPFSVQDPGIDSPSLHLLLKQ